MMMIPYMYVRNNMPLCKEEMHGCVSVTAGYVGIGDGCTSPDYTRHACPKAIKGNVVLVYILWI